MRLVLRGGRLLDPAGRRDGPGEILVVDGQLAAIGPKVEASGAKVIELDGAWVCPGFVDLHSVLRDERDLDSALRGGFTTVVAAPESPRLHSDRLQVLSAAPLTRKLEEGHISRDFLDVPLTEFFIAIACGVVSRPLMMIGGAVMSRALAMRAATSALPSAGGGSARSDAATAATST